MVQKMRTVMYLYRSLEFLADVGEVIDERIGKLIRLIERPIEGSIKLYEMNRERVQCLKYLLDTGAYTFVIPAWEHVKAFEYPEYAPPSGKRAYPLEMEVAHQFRSLFGDDSFEEVLQLPEPEPEDGVLAIGSPVSNPYTVKYLGDPRHRSKEVRPRWWSAKLEYRFETDRSGPNVARYQYDMLWEVPNTILSSARGSPCTPRHELKEGKRWLKTDYLLLSRLPGEVRGGGDVVIIAGTHGIATKAAGLLLQTISVEDLKAVLGETNGARYYQAVFEVPEIDHDHDGVKSEPKSLIKSREAHAVALKIDA